MTRHPQSRCHLSIAWQCHLPQYQDESLDHAACRNGNPRVLSIRAFEQCRRCLWRLGVGGLDARITRPALRSHQPIANHTPSSAMIVPSRDELSSSPVSRAMTLFLLDFCSIDLNSFKHPPCRFMVEHQGSTARSEPIYTSQLPPYRRRSPLTLDTFAPGPLQHHFPRR